jgi:hypothetical protein
MFGVTVPRTPNANGCITVNCAAGLTPDRNPIRDSADVRNDVADGASLVGRGAGVVSNTATAIEVGSPDPRVKAGAAAVGVVSTVVDFASKVVEQVARPNTGQGIVEVGATVLGDIANKVAPIAAPISNEIVEKMKNTDEVKTIQEKIGK